MAHFSLLHTSIAVLLTFGVTVAHAKTTKKAEKAHSPVKVTRQAAKIQTLAKTEITSVASETRPDTPACRKVRRRFWLDDQGWIVRQVSSCS